MKKILLSLLTIALVSTVAFGATKAYFSDSETSTGNSFTAGTLDLTADGKEGTAVMHITRSNLYPSKPWSLSWGGEWILRNVGTVPGVFSVTVQNIQNGTTSCNGPKVAALAAASLPACVPSSSTGGRLGSLMYGRWMENPELSAPSIGWTGSAVFNPFNTMGGTIAGLPLNSGQAVSAYLDLEWDTHAGTLDNTAQGDTLSFDVVFNLDQVHP